jgi:hypothetical protein
VAGDSTPRPQPGIDGTSYAEKRESIVPENDDYLDHAELADALSQANPAEKQEQAMNQTEEKPRGSVR